jgi:hypothetical protein
LFLPLSKNKRCKRRKKRAEEITKWYDSKQKRWDAPHPYPSFPYPLPYPNRLADTQESVSPKTVIIQKFKPRGYTYRSNFSGNGIYQLVKRLSNHNRLVLHFEFTPIGRCLSCELTYEGLFLETHSNHKNIRYFSF